MTGEVKAVHVWTWVQQLLTPTSVGLRTGPKTQGRLLRSSTSGTPPTTDLGVLRPGERKTPDQKAAGEGGVPKSTTGSPFKTGEGKEVKESIPTKETKSVS